MLRATLKSLLARKLRLALTALAVVLGVGLTAGSFVLTDTALQELRRPVRRRVQGHRRRRAGQTAFEPGAAGNSGGGSERKPIPESVLPQGAGRRRRCRPRTDRSAARPGSSIRRRTR